MVFENVYPSDRLGLIICIPSAIFNHAALILSYASKMSKVSPEWWYAPLIYLGLIKSANLKLNDGKTFRLTKKTFHRFIGFAASNSFDYKKHRGMDIKREGDIFSFTISERKIFADAQSSAAVINEFASNFHRKLDVKDRIVLDVGAYVGETALLYVIAGKAKHVYAFEPVKHLYESMIRNIELNDLESKITPINALLVGDSRKYDSSNSFELSHDKVKKFQLSDFVKRFGVNNGVIKIDIEGGEYEIIRDSPSETLRCFESMHIEYHYGYKDIVERLKIEDMKVRYGKPELSIVGKFTGAKYCGDIVARNRKVSLD